MRAFLAKCAVAAIIGAAIWCYSHAGTASAHTYAPSHPTVHATKKAHR
jgi:hypothetical protein